MFSTVLLLTYCLADSGNSYRYISYELLEPWSRARRVLTVQSDARVEITRQEARCIHCDLNDPNNIRTNTVSGYLESSQSTTSSALVLSLLKTAYKDTNKGLASDCAYEKIAIGKEDGTVLNVSVECNPLIPAPLEALLDWLRERTMI